MPNVSHESHLIFMRMTVQVTYIFIPIVSLKDSFCHRGKSKLGIGLFIHELLREPLIYYRIVLNQHDKMQLFAKFKKILRRGFRATFQDFEFDGSL